MADHAKAEWHNTPESVRGEVGRMHREMSDAYQKFKADHEEMNTIRHFQQMAREHGTTLQRAMTNYTTMERKLVSDPYGAFDMIVSNLNLRTPEGQKLTFRDLAYDYLSQTPEQHKMVQAQNAQSAQGYQLGALHQKVDAIANGFQQMQYRPLMRTRDPLSISLPTVIRGSMPRCGSRLNMEAKPFTTSSSRPSTRRRRRRSTTASCLASPALPIRNW